MELVTRQYSTSMREADLDAIKDRHGVRHICQDGRVYDAERKCDAIQLAEEVERLRGLLWDCPE